MVKVQITHKVDSLLDEPTFVDLEPREPVGTSGDGYIWKYLYTIKPNQIIKFDSIDFMPVPNDWGVEKQLMLKTMQLTVK